MSFEELRTAQNSGFDAFICGGERITEETAALLRETPTVRLLLLLSAGYDRLFRYGIADNISICNAGDALSPVVAEHAIALLLALVRQLPASAQLQREHRWDKIVLGPKLRSLDDMTVAVLGLGSIGREVAKRATAFGSKVLGVSRSASPYAFAAEVHPSSALHEVLARSDAVVIATPLTPETRHLINDAAFSAIKPGALVVNISRGQTLDQDALVRALDSGAVGGAGLDVQDPEPLPPNSPLWDRPDVIITPHLAGLGGVRSRVRLAEVTLENIKAFMTGGTLQNCIRDRRN